MSLRLMGKIYISVEPQIDDLQFGMSLWSLERSPEVGSDDAGKVM